MSLFALFGGMGEFDDWSIPVHRQLVDRGARDGSVRILPTLLDDETIANEDLALYERIGVPAVVLPVRSRADAEQQENADALRSCSLIFMHGGAGDWLVDTFQSTRVWQAVLDVVARGVSLAATSGGIECLGGNVPVFPTTAVPVGGWQDSACLLAQRSVVTGTARTSPSSARRTSSSRTTILWSRLTSGP